MRLTWYAIVESGSYANTPPAPHGPWRSRAEAEAALSRFRDRLGADADSHLAACSTRIVGPFATRDIARYVTINNYQHVEMTDASDFAH